MCVNHQVPVGWSKKNISSSSGNTVDGCPKVDMQGESWGCHSGTNQNGNVLQKNRANLLQTFFQIRKKGRVQAWWCWFSMIFWYFWSKSAAQFHAKGSRKGCLQVTSPIKSVNILRLENPSFFVGWFSLCWLKLLLQPLWSHPNLPLFFVPMISHWLLSIQWPHLNLRCG